MSLMIKKSFYFLLFASILLPTISFAQLNLERTYTTSTVGSLDTYFFTFYTESGLNYFTYDEVTQEIKIYNENHLLIKSFTAPIPVDYIVSGCWFVTDKLFNSNNSVEFLFSIYSNSDSINNKIILFDDNGNNIQDFADRSYAGISKTSNNEYKLILRESKYTNGIKSAVLDVYSLPGTLSLEQDQLLSANFVTYPNPTSSIITIKSSKTFNKDSILQVFDIGGKKVIEKKLTEGNKDISVDVTTLNSGLYVYKINDVTGKFIKK